MTARFTAQQAIETALEHSIVPDGFNIHKEDIRQAWIDGRCSDDWLAQINACADYYASAKRIVTKSAGSGSYGLKHNIENAAGRYISNGAALLAAYLVGVTVWPYYGTFNGQIGISRRYAIRRTRSIL